jgi:hypothetical protein
LMCCTIARAFSAVSIYGRVSLVKLMFSNCASRLWPSVSAVIPVPSDMKNAVRFIASGTLSQETVLSYSRPLRRASIGRIVLILRGQATVPRIGTNRLPCTTWRDHLVLSTIGPIPRSSRSINSRKVSSASSVSGTTRCSRVSSGRSRWRPSKVN